MYALKNFNTPLSILHTISVPQLLLKYEYTKIESYMWHVFSCKTSNDKFKKY